MPSASVAGGGVGICDRPQCVPIRDARRATPRPAASAPNRPASSAGARTQTRAEAVAATLDRIRAGRSPLLLNLLDRSHTPRTTKQIDGQRIPAEMTKRLDPPPIVDMVHVPTAYRFRRDHDGPVVVLDRTAAWVAAMAVLEVAHGYGGWRHTGAIELPPTGPIPPGWYEVVISAWTETGLPSPLPATTAVPVGGTVWVAEPLVKLLRDLAEAQRWGGGELQIVDSYTHPVAVRLDEGGWASAQRDIRAAVLDEFGADSPHYVAVKRSYAQAVQTMRGTPDPGNPRKYIPSGIHRDDIADAVKTMMAVTVWRNADAINKTGHPVVALTNTDEIHITPEALTAITSGPHTAGRPRIDESGVKIGTYKTKAGTK